MRCGLAFDSHGVFIISSSLLFFSQDKLEKTFIPTGFDTDDLVGISCGLSAATAANLVSQFRSRVESEVALPLLADTDPAATETTSVGSEQSAASAAAPLDAGLDLEPEQDWLSGLQSFANQLSAAAPAPRLATSHSDPSLTALAESELAGASGTSTPAATEVRYTN